MSEHKRRDGYWQYYEPAKETGAPHLKGTVIEMIRERLGGDLARRPIGNKEFLTLPGRAMPRPRSDGQSRTRPR